MSTATTDAPTLDIANGTTAPTIDGPTEETLEEFAASEQKTAQAEAPTLTPPAETAVAADAGAVTAAVWHRDIRITATWCNASARNAYAAVSGLGWRRISPANDSCFVVMTALLAHAEATGKRTDVKLDGNTIVEVYVF